MQYTLPTIAKTIRINFAHVGSLSMAFEINFMAIQRSLTPAAAVQTPQLTINDLSIQLPSQGDREALVHATRPATIFRSALPALRFPV